MDWYKVMVNILIHYPELTRAAKNLSNLSRTIKRAICEVHRLVFVSYYDILRLVLGDIVGTIRQRDQEWLTSDIFDFFGWNPARHPFGDGM